jgi:hypothetical protein
VRAAWTLHQALAAESWPTSTPLRVRVAIHTGESEFRDGDYFGRAVNRAARLRSVASGGQILLSRGTADLVADALPEGTALAYLGDRVLRDLHRPEYVFELRAAGEAVPTTGPAPEMAVGLLTDENGRKIGRVHLSGHGYTGYGGPDGFFSVPVDVYINPDGTGGLVARELFEGTIDGRTGAMVFWVEGTFDHLRAGGKFAGFSYTIRGMEGLTGIQHKAYFVGVFGKGYEWVDGVYCWNGFNGMYDNDGNETS